jgi:protein-tyrosine phosphatase
LYPWFIYKIVNIEDDETVDISVSFEECCSFVWGAIESGTKVYVHCQAGISRSPSVVIYILMDKLGMSLRDAFEHVRARRKVLPNLGFFQHLINAEQRLRGSTTMTMEEYTTLYTSTPFG